MSEHVYVASIFWTLVTHVSKITSFLGPWLILIGCIAWALRIRSWQSNIALVAGVLVGGAHLSHLTIAEVYTIALGGQQPTVDENPFAVFFYLHGLSFGYTLLGFALISNFIRRRSVA